MKRPGVVWIFTIFLSLGVLWKLFEFFAVLSEDVTIAISGTPIMSMIIELILIVLDAILIYHFFTLKRSAIMWAHISFGSALGVSIIKMIIILATVGSGGLVYIAPSFVIGMVFYIFFWWAVVDYVKKKEVDGAPLFT